MLYFKTIMFLFKDYYQKTVHQLPESELDAVSNVGITFGEPAGR